MKEYDERVSRVLEELGKAGVEKIIAFSGSVPRELEVRAEQVVEDSFQILQEYRGRVAIQTGGTNFDIQRYAAERAKRLGMPLIGVYPSRGAKYAMQTLDFAIEVEPRWGESEWGDDSEIFSKLPDGVELIGGSLGTLIEFGHLMKRNDTRIKRKEKVVYISPVVFAGTPTTADLIYRFPLKSEQRECMLRYPTVTGFEAARFLVEKVLG